MKPSKPNSIKPWSCVILAIDPGKVSGVAIYHNGNYDRSGITEGKCDQNYWCLEARYDAHVSGLPLIVVIESHVHHGKWSPKAMAGTAESVGVWKHYIEQLPDLKWKPKILRVPVDEWRKGIYGFSRKNNALVFDKDTRILVQDYGYWKKMACKIAGVEDDDEAEAILIGKYAVHWWKVGEQAGVKHA